MLTRRITLLFCPSFSSKRAKIKLWIVLGTSGNWPGSPIEPNRWLTNQYGLSPRTLIYRCFFNTSRETTGKRPRPEPEFPYFRRTSGKSREAAGIVRAMSASRTRFSAGISRRMPERDNVDVGEVRLLAPRQIQCLPMHTRQLARISSDLSPNVPICSGELEAIEVYLGRVPRCAARLRTPNILAVRMLPTAAQIASYRSLCWCRCVPRNGMRDM